jgi:hypothetical protein
MVFRPLVIETYLAFFEGHRLILESWSLSLESWRLTLESWRLTLESWRLTKNCAVNTSQQILWTCICKLKKLEYMQKISENKNTPTNLSSL